MSMKPLYSLLFGVFTVLVTGCDDPAAPPEEILAEGARRYPGPCVVTHTAAATGESFSTTNFRYGPDSLLLKEETLIGNADPIRNTIEYGYAGNGKRIEKTLTYANGVDITRYEYGIDGRLKSDSTDNDGDESIESIVEYFHDDQGRIITQKEYQAGGANPIWTYTYSYDGAGNQIRSFAENHTGGNDSVEEFSYDKWGNRVKGVLKNHLDSPVFIIRYDYSCWE